MADSKDGKILFVCLRNICRSPSAEAILKHLLEKRGNSADWEIDSAGILEYLNTKMVLGNAYLNHFS